MAWEDELNLKWFGSSGNQTKLGYIFQQLLQSNEKFSTFLNSSAATNT